MSRKRVLYLLLGPAAALICLALLPHGVFTTAQSRMALGIVAWMAIWWVAGPVDYAVTAFIPIAVNALYPMVDMSTLIANYASETIMLLLGASILTVTWEETGLDKRIALGVLSMVGNNFRTQIIFWFLLSAVLSSVLPNAVVCATITPIAVAMLSYIGEGEIGSSKKGSKLLLTIAYAAGVGGLATPLGGAMNLVTVSAIQQVTGEEYAYSDWVVRFLPIMIILLISNIMFMLHGVAKDEKLEGSREYLQGEFKKMPPMSKEEKWSLGLFVVAVILSFTRQFYQDLLPGLTPAYVFIICAVIAFLIVKENGVRLIRWNKIQGKIVWGLMYVFAGGLALGTLINDSGAAEDIGKMVSKMNLSNTLFMVFIIVTVTLLLSDVTSNTATASVAMPIVISICNGMGLDPIPYIYVASIGVNLSYMLPTSIRAIPVGYGLSPKYMFSQGWKMSIMVIILMTAAAYILLPFLGA